MRKIIEVMAAVVLMAAGTNVGSAYIGIRPIRPEPGDRFVLRVRSFADNGSGNSLTGDRVVVLAEWELQTVEIGPDNAVFDGTVDYVGSVVIYSRASCSVHVRASSESQQHRLAECCPLSLLHRVTVTVFSRHSEVASPTERPFKLAPHQEQTVENLTLGQTRTVVLTRNEHGEPASWLEIGLMELDLKANRPSKCFDDKDRAKPDLIRSRPEPPITASPAEFLRKYAWPQFTRW